MTKAVPCLYYDCKNFWTADADELKARWPKDMNQNETILACCACEHFTVKPDLYIQKEATS